MSILVSKLEKKFNKFTAVRNVTFQVEDGEFVTLLGPSGSGKSTILRCIAGLEKPESGHIQINGEDVTGVSVQDRKVGFVFQHYALFSHMTVGENIGFGLKVKGTHKKDRQTRIDELIDLFELEGFENRLPSQLSGGQRQRVALARALAPEPKLLLLDEPFGALDTRLRKELRTWIKALHDRIRLTTVMVTHDQDEALELSNRIVVINKGLVEQDDSPWAIFNKPASEFVAKFVGETNQVTGTAYNQLIEWGPFKFWAPHVPDGKKAIVLFRPNDVYVSSRAEEGSAPGTIQSLQFLGALDCLEIKLENQFVVTAYVPKGVAEQSRFTVGKNVYVSITTAHVFETKH